MNPDWLFERFGRAPDATALVWRDRPYTYAGLAGASAALENDLAARGIGPAFDRPR